MDQNQKESLFRAIAISTAVLPQITPQSRQEAFETLESFKKFDGRVGVILELLQTESLSLPYNNGQVDITASTKLYLLGVLQQFLKTNYAKLGNENDRISIRNAVLVSARQLLAKSVSVVSTTNVDPVLENEQRFLATKIASLIADIATRDFPQRWTTFVTDIFAPPSQGGLWYIHQTEYVPSRGYGPFIGVKMCLECLKVITEDCTDGDFNSKISASRRNDVLIGLNEVKSQFLPLFFELLSSQYSIVNSTKANLNEMYNYLLSSGRTIYQMSPEEKPMYEQQVMRKETAGRIVADCLGTLEKFCQSMPTEWIMSTDHGDFVAAMLHLLREDTANLHTLTVACLQQLFLRKIDFSPWLRLISALPQAISESNETLSNQDNILARAEGKTLDASKILVKRLSFHRALSKMLSSSISSHIAHITSDKDIVKDRGPNFQILSNFLNLLADMLSHPSPKICAEQYNTWSLLLRDPQINKTQSRLLQPCVERILIAYMNHLVRIRWEDVEDQNHPHSELLEETFDDKEAYDLFVGDYRSKAVLLIRLISAIEPKLATTVIYQKFERTFSTYASGNIRDNLTPSGELSQRSTAVLEFEGINQPLDNLINGLPEWALDDSKRDNPSFMEPHRVEVRNAIRTMLGDIANKLISWNPADTWLKFRRVTLLESLKYYWPYDTTRLVSAVEIFLRYLGENATESGVAGASLSEDLVSLRKKSGVSLVAVTKKVPHLLVGWLPQLSSQSKILLSSDTMLPMNSMHLYEFLSCVATAIEDPTSRSSFISDVLANAMTTIESSLADAYSSVQNFSSFLGIEQAENNPTSLTDKTNVNNITNNYVSLFTAYNQLLSVGKRCHEAVRSKPNAGIPLSDAELSAEMPQNQQNFPDEGPVSIAILSINDPFVHLWPRILPPLLKTIDAVLGLWHPEYQAKYLCNSVQRFVYAISDDEAYLAKNQNMQVPGGGVFGEDGTAGSVVSGWSRRSCNLAPRWSGWLNEIRNTTFQMIGLLAASRTLFSPDLAHLYPQFVSTVANPIHLKYMEHRHMTQYMKQVIDYIMLSCPSTLYQSHVTPIAAPFFEHMENRLKMTWAPILKINGTTLESTKPLTTQTCESIGAAALQGGDEWISAYYARCGMFIGDLDAVTGEAAVEKARVELSRCYADMLQDCLALKGDWSLVLANVARELNVAKENDPSLLEKGPSSNPNLYSGNILNADGTKRSKFHYNIQARKLLRIDKLCHFLLLENETIAGYLVLSVAELLNYPDAHTCRRVTKLCHRILETVAWVERYTQLLGTQMFTNAVKAVVMEQKWMVGSEWDMISIIRDMYCRLVLGQYLQCGGQGAAMQTIRNSSNTGFEQTKVYDKPLEGGGVLCSGSDLPRQVLASLPGITPAMVMELDTLMRDKLAAKDQREALRDLLRIAAENIKQAEGENGQDLGILGRATESESWLNQMERDKNEVIQALPEKLVTQSMINKQMAKEEEPTHEELGSNFFSI